MSESAEKFVGQTTFAALSNNKVLTKCGHTYCKECITKLTSLNDNTCVCPTCRTILKNTDFYTKLKAVKDDNPKG